MRNLLSVLILLLWSCGISAQSSLTVKVLNPPQNIKPEEPFTLFVEVSGSKTFDSNIDAELLLPQDWRILMTKKPALIKGERSLRFMFTVSVSTFTASGRYNVGIMASGRGYESEIENLSIEVLRIRKLDIQALNIPEYVKEGDTLRTEYFIQNSGNTTEKLVLKSLDGKIILPQEDKKMTSVDSSLLLTNTKKKVKKVKVIDNLNRLDTVSIASNQSVKIKVIQVVPITKQNSWSMSSNLEVTMTDSSKAISNTTTIPVFSKNVKKSDPYLRFPIEVGGSYNRFKFGNNEFGGFQYDVRGKGHLDFAQKHYLDFTIHGPNQFDLPSIGTYDVYSAEYSFKKNTDIILGDYSLRMNNLMELGRFGRGFKIEQVSKKIDFTAFYIKPRFFSNQKDTYGSVFTVKPSEKFNISLNYLHKVVEEESKIYTAELIGISNKIFLKSFSLENEFAASFAPSQTGFGIFSRLSGKIGRLLISSNLVYTDKEFTGFYRDSYLFVNSFNYLLSKKINLYLNSNITRLNPNLDQTVLLISPYSQNNTLGLNYQISKTNRLFLAYENREREDRSNLKKFYFKEEYGRFTYNVNSPSFTLYAESRLGTSQNLLVKSDSSVNQRTFQAVFQPQLKLFNWLWLGTFFNYQRNSNFSSDNKLNDFYFYGGSAKLIYSKYFTANINYRNNYAPDELIEQRSFLDISANLKLKNHEFSFSGGKSFIPTISGVNQNVEFYTLKYILKLNAPIARNKKLSSIKGQILGLSNNISPKGIIVELGGRKYMTDANGSFQFNDLPADRYFLNVVRSTMGSGVVSTVKNPLEIVVKPDTSYKIEIPLVKTGNILGKIIFKKSDAVGAIDITKQKPIVLVKLFNEKDSYLTQVNEKDEFSFKEIKPGKWKVSASTPGKVDQFTILNTDDVIDLGAEQVKTASVTIALKERKVYFSNKTHQLNNKSKK